MTFRIKKVQELLKRKNIQALIIDYPLDLFYLTGLEISLGCLLVTRSTFALFVDGRYFEMCHNHFPSNTYLAQDCEKNSYFAKFLHSKPKIGFDAHATTYEQFLHLRRTLYGRKSLIPLSSPIKHLRQIKENEEIVLLKESARLCAEGYDFLVSLFREGISEEEVALELEFFWKKKGGEKLAFNPIIAFGENSSKPHYRAGKRQLKKNDIILVDIGVVFHKYNSDMTRVIAFGKVDPELEKIYLIVNEAQKKALSVCAPGVSIKTVSAAALQTIASYGYERQYTHSLGHGVGLEIHEWPILKKVATLDERLKPGMVITIEPGIYLPGKGGVRLEDAIVITEEGYENLTQRPISEAIVSII